MFTGIVEKTGRIAAVSEAAEGLRVAVEADLAQLATGESVALDGVCLTVTEAAPGLAHFFVGAETLRRSTLADLRPDRRVNLERALRVGGSLSGHLVQGHVDGTARLKTIADEGESRRLDFELENALIRYCVPKGSIALSGVSLTLGKVMGCSEGGPGRLSVHVIPHTWRSTTLSALKVGDAVNVEVDLVAKYLERLCAPYRTT